MSSESGDRGEGKSSRDWSAGWNASPPAPASWSNSLTALTAPPRCPQSFVITIRTKHFAMIHLKPYWRRNTSGREVSDWPGCCNKGMSEADTPHHTAPAHSAPKYSHVTYTAMQCTNPMKIACFLHAFLASSHIVWTSTFTAATITLQIEQSTGKTFVDNLLQRRNVWNKLQISIY